MFSLKVRLKSKLYFCGIIIPELREKITFAMEISGKKKKHENKKDKIKRENKKN